MRAKIWSRWLKMARTNNNDIEYEPEARILCKISTVNNLE